MAKKSSKRSKSRRLNRVGGGGGDMNTGRAMYGGSSPAPLTPGDYNLEGAPMAKSQYYTISAGGGRRRKRKSRRSKKGGDGVIATAAVPFGLLALQRYFKGSKTSKQGVAKMGRTFKRTFRRQRGGSLGSKLPPLGASAY